MSEVPEPYSWNTKEAREKAEKYERINQANFLSMFATPSGYRLTPDWYLYSRETLKRILNSDIDAVDPRLMNLETKKVDYPLRDSFSNALMKTISKEFDDESSTMALLMQVLERDYMSERKKNGCPYDSL